MSATKLDLYKEHKDEYVTPKTPALVKIGRGKYLSITGQGEPAGEVFRRKLGALYNVAYTLKMQQKRAGRDYKVCALEGLWNFSGEGDVLAEPRETWQWKLIIRTPDFITAKDVKAVSAELLRKGKANDVAEVKLESIGEGTCVQMLHVGTYASETTTIAAMKAFAEGQGRTLHGLHHEIYLSDPRRVAPEKTRTILRLPVR